MENAGWRIYPIASFPFMRYCHLLFQFCFIFLYTSGLGQDILTQQSSISPLRKSIPEVSDPMLWKKYCQELKRYASERGYNNNLGFIVNMAVASGRYRFFVVDLKNDSLLMNGLVAHGSCNESWLEGRKYGNAIGCGCSSLGHYRIGASYQGKFGLAFKLTGLDRSNSNAMDRNLVLHSHRCVPNHETDPSPICQSLGCPMVSPNFLSKLQGLISTSHKPLILWILE